MKYEYYPNTIDLKLINQKKILSEFVLLQKKYVESFEFYIMKKINVKKYDLMLTEFSEDIHYIPDISNNIYKKCSYFESNYFYLRNNIHIERLKIEEINEIRKAIANHSILPFSFIKNTIYLMIDEGIKKISYGYDNLDDYFEPDIFIFEFSYFSLKINDVKNFITIKNHFEKIANSFCQEFNEVFNCKSTYRLYTGLPLLYNIDEMEIR